MAKTDPHDKWERMQERIPEPLIGLDRSHDLVSAPASSPASAPFSLLSDWIGRSVTANGRRERIGSGCGRKFLTFDSNSTSDRDIRCAKNPRGDFVGTCILKIRNRMDNSILGNHTYIFLHPVLCFVTSFDLANVG